MTLLTTLYKTLIVIAIASFFIFFYTFKMKGGNLRMEEEKEKPELKENNLELSTENPKLEEKVQKLEETTIIIIEELDDKDPELSVKEEPQLKEQEPELEEEIQEMEEEKVQKEFEEEKKTKLTEKNAEAQLVEEEEENEPELEQKIQELEKKNNSEVEKKEEEFCKPKTNVLFLKTHKTASTTLMKVFHRAASRNRLTVVKKVRPYKFQKFNRCSIYPLKPGNEYNIFTHHTMFNYEEMKDIMPENTTFLTILRDPVAQFESQYGYFSLEDVYGMDLATFADLDTSLPEWSRIKNLRRGGKNGRNPNCYDLGLDPELFDDEAAILGKVQELDRQFDLVMITELFNESMILMKDKLCWDELSDVVGIKTNVRRAEVKVNLSSDQKMKLREKNRADQILYDYFHQKFLRLIDAFGKEKMAEEVGKLRALTEEIDEVCMEYKIGGSSNQPKAKVKPSFRAGAKKHEVCRAIMKDESNWRQFSKKHFAEAIECED